MLPKETISAFIDAINSRIPPPVHTAGIEDTRPIPAVIIENMSVDEKRYHNSDFVGNKIDDSGTQTAKIYRHYYDLQLDLVVKDDDETQAFDYFGDLNMAIKEVGRNPRDTIHDHISDVSSGGSGGVSYQFYEPTETEISQSVVIETFYESIQETPDVLESILKQIEFVDADYSFN